VKERRRSMHVQVFVIYSTAVSISSSESKICRKDNFQRENFHLTQTVSGGKNGLNIVKQFNPPGECG
jgi:hypothetical protein